MTYLSALGAYWKEYGNSLCDVVSLFNLFSMGKYPPNRNNVFREEKLQKSPAILTKGEDTAKSTSTDGAMPATRGARSPSNEILADSAKGDVTATKPSSGSNRVPSISAPASLQLPSHPDNVPYKLDSDADPPTKNWFHCETVKSVHCFKGSVVEILPFDSFSVARELSLIQANSFYLFTFLFAFFFL